MWHGDWQTKRVADAEFANSNPTAVILGAGHVGLDLAARLQALGIRTLLIERNSRVGDSVRVIFKCYHRVPDGFLPVAQPLQVAMPA